MGIWYFIQVEKDRDVSYVVGKSIIAIDVSRVLCHHDTQEAYHNSHAVGEKIFSAFYFDA